jgi:hypothetical protein
MTSLEFLSKTIEKEADRLLLQEQREIIRVLGQLYDRPTVRAENSDSRVASKEQMLARITEFLSSTYVSDLKYRGSGVLYYEKALAIVVKQAGSGASNGCNS